MDGRLTRWIDVMVAGAMLLAGLPLLAILVAAVGLADGWPIFFVQERAGRGGRMFRMYKFRSMSRHERGPLITAKGDKRITPLGRFLRRYKLDELPQLWNVLRGDMSLVGPRPEVPKYVDLADPRWAAVLEARPGLTDVATLLYRDEERVLAGQRDPETYYKQEILPRKLELNRRYAACRGVFTDCRLMMVTAQSILFPARVDSRTIEKMFLASPLREQGDSPRVVPSRFHSL